MIKPEDIAQLRLSNQQLTMKDLNSAKDLVNWMGAVQAQDFGMSKLAISSRLKNSNEEKINTSLDNAEILRTHLLRPTWHLVSADNIYWILNLSAPRLKRILKNRLKDLEISKFVLIKSFKILERNLDGNKSLSRKKIVELFKEEKIKTNENRASHILMQAELNGLICSGTTNKNDTTYALLEERVPIKNNFSKEESLSKLALKYFQSHSPAAICDFVWWSGLTIKDAQIALNSIKSDLNCEKIEGKELWFTDTFKFISHVNNSIFLLPAYDEFIISYKDRSASISNEKYRKAISINGLFRPTIVVNGKVIGIWKRKIEKDNNLIEIELFENQNKSIKSKIKNEAKKLKSFYNKNLEVNFI